MNAGIAPLLMANMDSSVDLDVCTKSASCVWTLVAAHDDNKDKFIALGLMAKLVQLMDPRNNNEELLEAVVRPQWAGSFCAPARGVFAHIAALPFAPAETGRRAQVHRCRNHPF
jgi:hypothetical protein